MSEPAKILFVDDEEDVEVMMKQRFRKQIKEKKFKLAFAQNGIEALKKLEEDPDIRMVVSDINMPEMDGLTLLSKINENFPNVIPVIVSAYGDMTNIRAAMNLGAFDFVTKPINFDDLNATIDKTQTHIQRLIDSERTKSRLAGILHELDVACEIQQSILPKEFISSNEMVLHARMTAAKQVGGDFYDFFWIDEDRLGFVIADVSGKGVPAALFMTVSRTLLREHALMNSAPSSVMTRVNNTLLKDNVNMMFVTTFYAVINVKTGEITYSNGGHNPVHIIRQDGKIESLTELHGMALGVVESDGYKEATTTLGANETIFLYTDGIPEAANHDGDCYGDQQLIDFLASKKDDGPDQIISDLQQAVVTFANGCEQSDDITMLAIKFKG